MFTRHFIHALVAASLSLPLITAGQTAGNDASMTQPSSSSTSSGQAARGTGEPVYGSQLMTPEERADYHAKMRAANTVEERERIHDEHHKEMQARAKERGVALPDAPRSRRGPGKGMGVGSAGEP